MTVLPLVSVVIPMFNEERSITACLGSVLAQDYPPDRMEILVIDGCSTDRSVELVTALAGGDPRVRVLENPRRLTVLSLNQGVQAARGEVYVRMDAHSTMEPDYVSRCVETLTRTGAQNVGGPMQAFGDNRRGEAIALATSSRFGVGGARFHYATAEGYVDTVYLGCYWLRDLRALGAYDERMIINEDDELNLRLTRGGGRVFLSPSIRSHYRCRRTLRSLWVQYFRYGKWKVRVMQKHRLVPSWRHLVPAAWVVSLGLGLVGWMLAPFAGWLVVASATSYAAANLLASGLLAARHGIRHLPFLVGTFLTLHLAYGVGFLGGAGRFLVLRSAAQRP